jgi:hypothetical protein
MLYAARYTYAHLELPGVTEAIEKSDWKAATQQADLLRQAIDRNTALLQTAREEFTRLKQLRISSWRAQLTRKGEGL